MNENSQASECRSMLVTCTDRKQKGCCGYLRSSTSVVIVVVVVVAGSVVVVIIQVIFISVVVVVELCCFFGCVWRSESQVEPESACIVMGWWRTQDVSRTSQSLQAAYGEL